MVVRFLFLFILIFIVSHPVIASGIDLFGTKHKKIGLLAPFSGKYKVLGEEILQGVELVNTKLEVIKFDTRGDWYETITKTRELIESEDVIAIIGPILSVNAIPAALIADFYKVPLITPTATDSRIRTISEYVYQLNTSIEAQAVAIAEYSTDILGIRRFATLYPNDTYGTNAVRIFKEEVKRRGGKLLKAISYAHGKKDFKEELLEIRDAAPGGLFIPAYPEDILMIAPQLWYYQVINDSIKILGTNGWGTEEVIKQGNKYVEGVIYSDFTNSTSYSEFDSKFLAAYGHEPTRISKLGYAAMLLISRAAEEGASSRNKLQKWLTEHMAAQYMPGVNRSWEYSINAVTLYTIKEGKPIEVR